MSQAEVEEVGEVGLVKQRLSENYDRAKEMGRKDKD